MNTDPQTRIGRYDVVAELGRGGMGVVYRGEDRIIGREVAIKVLAHVTPELRDRFYAEARSGILNHPNIVTVYEFGEHEGQPYIVMEYLEGLTLDVIIAEAIPLSLIDKLSIVEQVCAGLGYAHQNGVVHRDIKPANVIVQRDGKAKIVDFGIARMVDQSTHLTKTDQVIGSLHYIAPERLKGEMSDGRSDIWSVGVMLYQILSGELPFAGEEVSTLYKVLNEPHPSIKTLVPDIPDELVTIVDRALAKNPDDRYGNAEDMAVDLQSISDGLKKGRVGDLLTSAQLLMEQHQFDRARAVLIDIQRIDQQNIEAKRLMSDVRRELSKLQRAEQVRQLVEEAEKAVRSQNYDDAVSFYRQAMKFDPQSPLLNEKLENAIHLKEEQDKIRSLVKQAGESTVFFPKPIATEILRHDLDQGLVGQANESVAPGSLTQMFQSIGGRAQEVQPPPPQEGKPEEDGSRQPRAKLTITACADSTVAGETIRISHTPFVIGRGQEADLSIASEKSLSRKQCVIDWVDGAYVIRDLESKNGTWLNGRLLGNRTEVLLFGSTIRFRGNTALSFLLDDIPAIPDLTGQILAGRFKLHEVIREGKKSALYRGEDLRLPQSVVVKILSPELAAYPGYLDQLNREAGIAARLQHPHIAKVIDFGPFTLALEQGKEFKAQYVCTQFMEGGSLASRLSEPRFLKPSDVIQWLDPIAAALQYTHDKGIVHGGLKDTSVIFDGESRAYLTDFAFATQSSNPEHRVFFGTPEFMAPEQWDMSGTTPLTDQYSLGVLTYYALTGRMPFEKQHEPHARARNFEIGAIPVHEEAKRQGNTGVPASLSKVIAKAMSVKPDDRYPSVRDFYRSFETALKKSDKPSIFLSYSRDGATAWATLFYLELERRGISVYYDVQGRENVGPFPPRLERDIRRADVFVCIVSAKSLKSPWVRQEIQLARQHKKPMVPVLQEGFKVRGLPSSFGEDIQALLTSEGVPLFDRVNAFVPETISLLAAKIEKCCAGDNYLETY